MLSETCECGVAAAYDSFLLLNRNLSINIGEKNTIDWDFRYDSCYSRRYCVVLSAETFITPVMGHCRNNNPKDKQTTKD